jgi:4-diphosphocytidyl-2-C-methyl-D-erythritol kinase
LTALAATARAPHGFTAVLHKRIPHGGGLGGGSSDAAAALRLGNELLAVPLAPADLHALAVPLGADVAFFLRGGSQWGRGIGDELTPAPVPPMWFVLLVPPFGCPTAAVYKNYAALWKDGGPQDTVVAVTVPNTRDSAVRIGFANDLEPAAERVRPELAALRARVTELGYPHVRMAGSGSTLFVAVDDEAEQQRCLAALGVLRSDGVRLVPTRSAGGALDAPVLRSRPGSAPGPRSVPER